MKKTIPTVEEVLSHFRSLMPTERQQKYIYDHSMKNQYIVVTHGKQAIQDYMARQAQNGRSADKVRVKDRIGHCTRCHHEFVLPEDWRLSSLAWNGYGQEPPEKCPVCGGEMWLVSGYQGRKAKTIMQYIVFFESSIKDPTVILAKGLLAVRSIEGDYRTCQTIYYPVTLWMFKKKAKNLLCTRGMHGTTKTRINSSHGCRGHRYIVRK